jgi:hypothetical protein
MCDVIRNLWCDNVSISLVYPVRAGFPLPPSVPVEVLAIPTHNPSSTTPGASRFSLPRRIYIEDVATSTSPTPSSPVSTPPRSMAPAPPSLPTTPRPPPGLPRGDGPALGWVSCNGRCRQVSGSVRCPRKCVQDVIHGFPFWHPNGYHWGPCDCGDIHPDLPVRPPLTPDFPLPGQNWGLGNPTMRDL